MQLFFTQNGFDFQGYLSFLFVAFFAFAYHEFAHAIVADYLGDPTPRSYGRITFNPLVHIDRVGFILLALIGFGFATTPVNPTLMRGNPRHSHAIVAVAGPITNLLMAVLFALIYRLLPGDILFSTPWFEQFVRIGVWLNLLLFAFNLMPVPPLDGFTILLGILPANLAYQLMPLRQYGFMIFLGVFFLLPILGIDVFGAVLRQIFTIMMPLLLGGF